MNERTHFFIKIYLSHFILERVDASVVSERWVERTSSSHIFFQEPAGANACTPLQVHQRQPDWLHIPRSTVSLCTLSKTDRMVLIMWSPSGYSPVVPECPDMPSSSCLLIKMWQLAKAYRITWNKLKIHVICNITDAVLCHTQNTPFKDSYPSAGDTESIFQAPHDRAKNCFTPFILIGS